MNWEEECRALRQEVRELRATIGDLKAVIKQQAEENRDLRIAAVTR